MQVALGGGLLLDCYLIHLRCDIPVLTLFFTLFPVSVLQSVVLAYTVAHEAALSRLVNSIYCISFRL